MSQQGQPAADADAAAAATAGTCGRGNGPQQRHATDATTPATSSITPATADAEAATRDVGLASTPTAASAAMSRQCERSAAACEPESTTQPQLNAQTHLSSQPMPDSKSGQIDEVIAAMAAVPTHPPAAFVQRQVALLHRLVALLSCGYDSASFCQAASMLSAQQALVLFQVALRAQVTTEQGDQLIYTCALMSGLWSDRRSPHTAALLPAALAALADPAQQHSAVIMISYMFECCNGEEQNAIKATGFVDAAIRWLPTYSRFHRLQALSAACPLAQPQQQPPLMAALLPELLADSADIHMVRVVECLFESVVSSRLSLAELFRSTESAAAVAARLVQLTTQASGRILDLTWLTCLCLSEEASGVRLLLNSGLLQPALFTRALGSGQADACFGAMNVLVNFSSEEGVLQLLVQRGMLPIILEACVDDDSAAMRNAMKILLRCVQAASKWRSAHLRPAILQACAEAAFPSSALARLVIRLPNFPMGSTPANLAVLVMLLVGWPQSAVHPARLHPLAQRMVEAGLLPYIEDMVRAPLAPEPLEGASISPLTRAVAVSDFLRACIYGRSRMPPLTALLQRQYRPTPPLPYRLDSLLLQEPGWFDERVSELDRLKLQHELDIRRRDLEHLRHAMARAMLQELAQ